MGSLGAIKRIPLPRWVCLLFFLGLVLDVIICFSAAPASTSLFSYIIWKYNGLTADCSSVHIFPAFEFTWITQSLGKQNDCVNYNLVVIRLVLSIHLSIFDNTPPVALFQLLGYCFFCRPFVEYKGAVPQNEVQSKQKELELEASNLITKGGKVYMYMIYLCISINFYSSFFLLPIVSCPCLIQVSVSILPYDKASELCGGSLPDYIPNSKVRTQERVLVF